MSNEKYETATAALSVAVIDSAQMMIESLRKDREYVSTTLAAARQEIASLRAQLESADNRLRDMLLADDGQAYKEARKYLERRAQPAVQTQRTGLCCRSHPHEKQGMQCQLLEVSAVLRWHAAAFAAPSADSMLLYADQVDAVAHALPAVQPKSANEMTAKRVIGAFSN